MSSSHQAETVLAVAAGEDLSAKQYHLVKYGATKDTVVACVSGDLPLGVLKNAPASGELAEVVIAGGAEVKCGGTIPVGAYVGPDNAGKAVEKTTGLGLGVAMDAAVDGDVLGILIDRIKL